MASFHENKLTEQGEKPLSDPLAGVLFRIYFQLVCLLQAWELPNEKVSAGSAGQLEAGEGAQASALALFGERDLNIKFFISNSACFSLGLAIPQTTLLYIMHFCNVCSFHFYNEIVLL